MSTVVVRGQAMELNSFVTVKVHSVNVTTATGNSLIKRTSPENRSGRRRVVIIKGGASFDGQHTHILKGKRRVQHRNRVGKLKLSELQIFVLATCGIADVHCFGVGKEAILE
nr:hypothetical protein Iba_chr08aCG6460 [Ipomoea batatas]GMD24913.1 hypothetical protein Iba_chr08cCG5100 [Ipomoea batatas]